jgi:hypothetical protein
MSQHIWTAWKLNLLSTNDPYQDCCPEVQTSCRKNSWDSTYFKIITETIIMINYSKYSKQELHVGLETEMCGS